MGEEGAAAGVRGQGGDDAFIQALDGDCSQIHTRFKWILSLRVCLKYRWISFTDAGGPFTVCAYVFVRESTFFPLIFFHFLPPLYLPRPHIE